MSAKSITVASLSARIDQMERKQRANQAAQTRKLNQILAAVSGNGVEAVEEVEETTPKAKGKTPKTEKAEKTTTKGDFKRLTSGQVKGKDSSGATRTISAETVSAVVKAKTNAAAIKSAIDMTGTNGYSRKATVQSGVVLVQWRWKTASGKKEATASIPLATFKG